MVLGGSVDDGRYSLAIYGEAGRLYTEESYQESVTTLARPLSFGKCPC